MTYNPNFWFVLRVHQQVCACRMICATLVNPQTHTAIISASWAKNDNYYHGQHH